MNRSRVLYARWIDQNSHRSEFFSCLLNHRGDGSGLREVRIAVSGAHSVRGSQTLAQALDFCGIAESIEQNIGTFRGQTLAPSPTRFRFVDPVWSMATLPSKPRRIKSSFSFGVVCVKHPERMTHNHQSLI